MKPKRSDEILSAGLAAAREQMKKHPARADYPADYMRLYGWLEDKLFNLYGAIRHKDYAHIYTMSGEIIITASEIAEYARYCLCNPVMPERKELKNVVGSKRRVE